MKRTVLAGVLALTVACAGDRAMAFAGPDIILHDIPSVMTFGPINGTYAYVIGGGTCNIGTANHEWDSNGSPGLAMNLYRLYDGRLEQIGQGFPKHACCVVNGSGCTGFTCQAGGTGLRVGCRDVYSASFNSNQARLGPRSGINAFSGTFSPIPAGSGDALWRRLQVAQADMDPVSYPGALYFVEGVFVGRSDAQNFNWLNNATYQRVTMTNNQMALVAGSGQSTVAAIRAWRDHGNGVNNPDTNVQISDLDVPSEGRFKVGARVRDNGDGTWRYDYAVYNLNSDRSGGSFSVNVPEGTNISNVGFHDVRSHSGEPYDNTDWVSAVGGSKVSWSSPQAFAENINSNAIRWGTMYNFWFTADRAPSATGVSATLGLFKPHTPASVSLSVLGPGVGPCPADTAPGTGDGTVNMTDLLFVIANFGGGAGNPADINGDNVVDINDILDTIAAWGACG